MKYNHSVIVTFGFLFSAYVFAKKHTGVDPTSEDLADEINGGGSTNTTKPGDGIGQKPDNKPNQKPGSNSPKPVKPEIPNNPIKPGKTEPDHKKPNKDILGGKHSFENDNNANSNKNSLNPEYNYTPGPYARLLNQSGSGFNSYSQARSYYKKSYSYKKSTANNYSNSRTSGFSTSNNPYSLNSSSFKRFGYSIGSSSRPFGM